MLARLHERPHTDRHDLRQHPETATDQDCMRQPVPMNDETLRDIADWTAAITRPPRRQICGKVHARVGNSRVSVENVN